MKDKSRFLQVVSASMIGNTLEFYDFTLFVFLAPVISPLFFPAEDKVLSIIMTLATYAVGFLVRPLGALVFGYIGDIYNRKTALTLSILLMAIPTGLMGMLPTYESIGISASFLMIALRIFQGFCTGGEYNGSAIFVVENTPFNPGLAGGIITSSSALGSLLGSLVATIVLLPFMPTWAWRIAFFVGVFIGLIGLYIRHFVPELYSIEPKSKTTKSSKIPLLNVLKHNPRAVFCTMSMAGFSSLMCNISMAYTNIFLSTFKNWQPWESLRVMTIGMLFYIGLAPLSGFLADSLGPKKILKGGALATLFLCYPLFMLLNTGQFLPVLIAQLSLTAVAAWFQGPMNLFMAQLFSPEGRYSGLAFGYSVGIALFGGTTTMIATSLVKYTGNALAPTLYIALGAIAGYLAVVYAPLKRENFLSLKNKFLNYS